MDGQSFRGEKFFDKPLQVTKTEAEGIMKFVDAIKPGVYIKCSQCKKFKLTDDAYITDTGAFCKECG